MFLTMELIGRKNSTRYVNSLVYIDKDGQEVHASTNVVLAFGFSQGWTFHFADEAIVVDMT